MNHQVHNINQIDLFVWHLHLQFPYFCQPIAINVIRKYLSHSSIPSTREIFYSCKAHLRPDFQGCWDLRLLKEVADEGQSSDCTQHKEWQWNRQTEQQAPSQSHPSLPGSSVASQNKSQKCAKHQKKKWVAGFVSFHPHDIEWRHLINPQNE